MTANSRVRRLLRFALLVGVVALPMEEAHANQRSLKADMAVARCIARSSHGRPWLERTLWGLHDQEGGWVGAEIANRDGSHDLGPLQINSWWVPKLAALTGRPAERVRLWLRHDACFNVDAARWIFLSALAASRNYWRAVGIYHSPTAWRARRYAASVAAHLRRRYGPHIFTTGESR